MPSSREGLVDACIDVLPDRSRAGYSWEVKTERIVFAVAAAAVVAHLVDHLLVGVVMDLQFDVVLAFGWVTAAAALVYPRLPRQLQVVGSIALGLGWLVGDFVLHALPTIRDGPHATDYTGLGATVAGGLLIGVGIAAALRPGNGSPAHPRPGPGGLSG
ncbi:MAG: hypothetical protein ACXVUL_19945 [Solirubrobacteraceae bacterium]